MNEIEDQDHNRDSIFRGFADVVKSNLHHFNPRQTEGGA
jgi:hypothetical protein